MFRIENLADSPLGSEILTPPDLEKDYGSFKDYEDNKAIRIGLPSDAWDAISIIIKKYDSKYKTIAMEHNSSPDSLIHMEDELTPSVVLRCSMKVGFKIMMDNIGNPKDSLHKTLRIMNDISQFTKILKEDLYYETYDEDVYQVGDLFGMMLDRIARRLDSKRLWEQTGKIIYKPFKPYPKSVRAVAQKATEWHLNNQTVYRITILNALNTELPLWSYRVLTSNIITPELSHGSKEERFSLLPAHSHLFIKTTLKKYDNYILEKVNKKKLCDEVKNVILELLE